MGSDKVLSRMNKLFTSVILILFVWVSTSKSLPIDKMLLDDGPLEFDPLAAAVDDVNILKKASGKVTRGSGFNSQSKPEKIDFKNLKRVSSMELEDVKEC